MFIIKNFRLNNFQEVLICLFYKTALFLAIEQNNIKIINILLQMNGLDINLLNILRIVFFI